MQFVRKENLLSLACQHQFCRSCWEQHCSVLVKDGVGVGESALKLNDSQKTSLLKNIFI
jgi:ariadne-2